LHIQRRNNLGYIGYRLKWKLHRCWIKQSLGFAHNELLKQQRK